MDIYDELRVYARVSFQGKDLCLDKIVMQVDLDGMRPMRGVAFVMPGDVIQYNERQERRKRLVDLIAAEFAHALTEALFKQ